MKNNYEICGDVTKIFLRSRFDKDCYLLIDTEDLPKLLQLPRRITVKKRDNNLYAIHAHAGRTTIGLPKEDKDIYIHRLVMDAPTGYIIDHINHDGLDNRKANLRIVDHATNMWNRRGAHKNSRSGIRNVCWVERDKLWLVSFQRNKKWHRVGYFRDLEDAKAAAIKARQSQPA